MELYFVQHGAAKIEAEHPRSELDRGGRGRASSVGAWPRRDKKPQVSLTD